MRATILVLENCGNFAINATYGVRVFSYFVDSITAVFCSANGFCG